ncbi:thiazole-phosphate synthase [Halothece sp. PCC 7418]|uniref:glycine oxidase ThiO n=1 Tax=Halothece sp. (strain PCC 7418) TaxID=65093 RepID=UPI0002A05E1E|nr:glycine oxidase ThiO [Halothece sp. PCC 7418]AFZ45495.1 thiazole-phosphate synthase [Halothece sp. PCC 7418]
MSTVIIGGGIIGSAIALSLRKRGESVTVVSRNQAEAAGFAAGGMIAPQAEAIPPSPLLDLALRSRDLYPDWINDLEHQTGEDTGYFPCGILAPVYEKSQAPSSPAVQPATWVDKPDLEFYQPGLGEDVIGAWWYPEDAQVDNIALMKTLLQAAKANGVEFREGVTVKSIQKQKGRITKIRTSEGILQADHYVLATGSWVKELLPLPVRPVKGQMMCLRMPDQPYPIQRVLFGPNTYLIPRQDGRLIIGATSEEVGWTGNNTPAGIKTLSDRAMRLYPELQDWSMEQIWWGFRPTTPDELPILGQSDYENLFLATGHHRHGVLLAPITAEMIAELITKGNSDPLLDHFRPQRFHSQNTRQWLNHKQSSSLTTMNGQNGHSHISHLSIANQSTAAQPEDQPLVIAGRTFQSRLLTGTGKFPNPEIMRESLSASGSQIVTVAVRRVQNNAVGHEGLGEALDWNQLWMLPNTAGCKTAEDAIRVAKLGREMAKLLGQEDNNFVKLEVIPEPKHLLPDPIGTLEAAEKLVKDGFAVLPYINADPVLAKRLEDVGCSTVMPLGSPIGSGQGIKTEANLQIIIEEANVPVVVDAGIGTPSEAAYAMELGADALLINSAIALAKNPIAMGRAMGMATEAGRLGYLAGRIPIKQYASASSPTTGLVGSST